MYYHCRPLKFVTYGKVFPPPIDTLEDYVIPSYQWLGKYCGYFPQVWLSRSASSITGYKREYNKNSILFAFDIIKGFPVRYNTWELVMGALFRTDLVNASKERMNKEIESSFIDHSGWAYSNKYEKEYENEDALVAEWRKTRDLEAALKKHLFVEHDQVVVPSLNLKAAKQILCRDEKQKKALRKMGFIEDRIVIKNIKFWSW